MRDVQWCKFKASQPRAILTNGSIVEVLLDLLPQCHIVEDGWNVGIYYAAGCGPKSHDVEFPATVFPVDGIRGMPVKITKDERLRLLAEGLEIEPCTRDCLPEGFRQELGPKLDRHCERFVDD